MATAGSYTCLEKFEVLFDPRMKERDSVKGTAVHVRTQLPLLSLGLHGADPSDRALRAAAAGELLVLHYFLWRVPRRECVHPCGSAAGHDAAARRVARIWAKVTDPNPGDADPG